MQSTSGCTMHTSTIFDAEIGNHWFYPLVIAFSVLSYSCKCSFKRNGAVIMSCLVNPKWLLFCRRHSLCNFHSRGCLPNKKSNPEGFDVLFAEARVHRDNEPRQIGLNHDFHLQFHFVNVSIIHLKYEYLARSERRFAWCSYCYVIWCPLTTGIVAPQCLSSKDAALVTHYLPPLISVSLNTLKRFIHQ